MLWTKHLFWLIPVLVISTVFIYERRQTKQQLRQEEVQRQEEQEQQILQRLTSEGQKQNSVQREAQLQAEIRETQEREARLRAELGAQKEQTGQQQQGQGQQGQQGQGQQRQQGDQGQQRQQGDQYDPRYGGQGGQAGQAGGRQQTVWGGGPYGGSREAPRTRRVRQQLRAAQEQEAALKEELEQHRRDDELLATSIDKLNKGKLAYSTPEKMKVSQTQRVIASIGGAALSTEALRAQLPTGNKKAVEEIATPISPRMKMTLKSADFDITSLSSDEQSVGGATPTTWEWDIIPKHSGTLHLHLAAIVEMKNLMRDFTAIDREVIVQVSPMDAASNFVKTNWQWIIATLTALGGAAWKLLKGRTGNAAATTTPGT